MAKLLICSWCKKADQTVSRTRVRGGTPWPPLCSDCSATVRAMSDRRARREAQAVPA